MIGQVWARFTVGQVQQGGGAVADRRGPKLDQGVGEFQRRADTHRPARQMEISERGVQAAVQRYELSRLLQDGVLASRPVCLGLAAQLKSVLFGLAGAENHIDLQGLLGEQRSKTVAWLHLRILHERRDGKQF